jgi:histidine triad (HIT) family protein
MPATILIEDEIGIVIKDINPQAAIHYLIIPKKHIKDINSCGEDDRELIANLVMLARKVSHIVSGAEEFKLLVNNGYNAGQRVFHLHMHFLADNNRSLELK